MGFARAYVANCSQIFYTLSSLYIIFLMTSVYARTREREKAWKFGLYCLAGSVIVAPFWYLIFQKWVIGPNTFMRVAMHLRRTRIATNTSADVMGLLRNPRVSMRRPATASLAPNDRSHGARLLLPCHTRYLPLSISSELDRPGRQRDWVRRPHELGLGLHPDSTDD